MVPPASSLTSATVLSLASTVSVAPNSMALSSRNLLESIAMTREAPHRPVVKMADRPTAPAPTTATVSPGRTFPGEHTDLMAGGQRVGQEDSLLARDVGGNGVQRGVGVRDPDRFTGFGDCADRLMAEDPAVGDGGHITVQNVQVGAADGGGHLRRLVNSPPLVAPTLAARGGPGCFKIGHDHGAGPQRSSARSRLTAALIKARWVNACGKLPSASPDAPTSSA